MSRKRCSPGGDLSGSSGPGVTVAEGAIGGGGLAPKGLDWPGSPGSDGDSSNSDSSSSNIADLINKVSIAQPSLREIGRSGDAPDNNDCSSSGSQKRAGTTPSELMKRNRLGLTPGEMR
jgi:hypothetical protein